MSQILCVKRVPFHKSSHIICPEWLAFFIAVIAISFKPQEVAVQLLLHVQTNFQVILSNCLSCGGHGK